MFLYVVSEITYYAILFIQWIVEAVQIGAYGRAANDIVAYGIFRDHAE